MATPNTTVALMLAAAGGVLVWTGIADPTGGITGALGSVLRGQPVTSAKPAGSFSLTKYLPAIWSPGASAAGGAGVTQASYSTGASGAGAAVLAESAKYLGTPYKFGGEDPSTGFDCSGLVQYVYKRAAGISMPRTAAQQAMTGRGIALDDAQPGDLIFWGVPAYHCGIALGGGRVRHAPQTGDVVKDSAIWSKGTAYARRVLAAPATSSSSSRGLISA